MDKLAQESFKRCKQDTFHEDQYEKWPYDKESFRNNFLRGQHFGEIEFNE